MARKRLRSIVVRKYRHHSGKNETSEKENILNRDFLADTVSQKLSPVTYRINIHSISEYMTPQQKEDEALGVA